MHFRPAAGVHVARLHDDLVVLDLASDSYLSLIRPVRGDDGDHPDDGGLDPGQQATLIDAGLAATVVGATAWRIDPHARQWRDLAPVARPGLSAGVVGDFVVALAVALWRSRQTLARLCRVPRCVGRAPLDPSALAGAVQVFDTIALWLPASGDCLFRATMLRVFLARRGLPTDLVFGVHLFPFRAHCWLAVENRVVGDAAHRVLAFEPIMTIRAA